LILRRASQRLTQNARRLSWIHYSHLKNRDKRVKVQGRAPTAAW
jgi:hypothetical protein